MPQTPVQRSILDGFQDMWRPNTFALGEIGNRACDLENAVVCPRAQMEFLHRPPQEFLPLEVQFAMGLELTVRHLSVGAALRFSSEALLLELSGAEHPISKQVPNL
jgi:hypothetical protein